MTATSTRATNLNFSFIGELEDKKSEDIKFFDEPRIINESIAESRCRAELLTNGYNKQVISFTTYWQNIKLNDIINLSFPTYNIPKELNKDRFIVKEKKTSIESGKFLMTLKVVRYD